MPEKCPIWDRIEFTEKTTAHGGRVVATGKKTIRDVRSVVFGYVSSKTEFKLTNGFIKTDKENISICWTNQLKTRNCITAVGRKKRGKEFKPLMREVAVYPKPGFDYLHTVSLVKKGYFKAKESKVERYLQKGKDLDELEGKVERVVKVNML